MTIIESERLLFRQLTQEDVTIRYVNWLNDPQVNQFLETRFVPQTLESCNKFVADMNADSLSHLLGIFDKESLKHIGNIKIGFINKYHQTGQLSLLIGEKSCWGKGYATESIKTITQWGFNTLNLKKISAGCYDTNIGSLRAFLKSGYSVEGYFRNNVVSADGRRIGSFWLGILKNDRAE